MAYLEPEAIHGALTWPPPDEARLVQHSPDLPGVVVGLGIGVNRKGVLSLSFQLRYGREGGANGSGSYSTYGSRHVNGGAFATGMLAPLIEG